MSDREFKLNVIFSICDCIVSLVSILCLCYLAISGGRWWIALFGLLPLAFYYGNRNIILIRGERDGRETAEENGEAKGV